MKNRWNQRGFALMTALALALPLVGLADEPEELILYEPAIYAEETDLPEDSDGTEPYNVPDDENGSALVLTPAPEAGDSAGESIPEDVDGAEPYNIPDDENGAALALMPAPEASKDSEGEPVPEVSKDSEGETIPEESKDTAGESVPETTGDSEGEPVPDTLKDSEDESAPEVTEDPEHEPIPEATGDSEGEPVPEAPKDSEDEPAPETSKAPEGEPAPEAAAAYEGKSAPEAAEIVEGETGDAAKALAEAASATMAFPAPKVYIGKGEWRANPVQWSGSADGVTVTYTSNKKKIVKVDAAGSLHGIKKGTAKITATASNGQKVTCTVKVSKAPSKVKLNVKKLTMGLGETRTLKTKLSKGSVSAITWTSANPAVVTVDATGNLQGVGAGTAKVTARTFNGKKAKCTVTVLGGRTPTRLSFPSATISMGLKEKRQLAPQLGEGEAAIFTFSSSNKKVVSVSRGGLMTAKKKGTAKITVKTHNGLKYRLTVKVTNAPTKVTLSKTSLTLLTGRTTTLKATLPSGTASALNWSSSDPNVASVDGSGNVQALNGGAAQISVSTFNGKSAVCNLTVTVPTPETVPPALSNAQMAANLRNSSAITSKKNLVANVAEMLMNAGYEPSFAAGFCANVYSEGNYGFFESSKYVANYMSRPRYFCFLDGGDYYSTVNGQKVVTTVYLSKEEYDAYNGPVADKRLRYGDQNYYMENWSGKYVWNHDLNELQKFMDLLTNAQLQDGSPDGVNDGKGWHGKFGLGCTQWTGGRTRKLMSFYRKYAGEGNPTITKEQAIAAEHEMILYDLQGDYKFVYTTWKNSNDPALYSAEAARSAGSLLCLKYEIPANKEASAVTRGERAAKFYRIMVGES